MKTPAGNIQFSTQNPFTNSNIINQNTFQFAIGGHSGRFFATLDALAQEGLLTTLAEPNLTTTNGQPAADAVRRYLFDISPTGAGVKPLLGATTSTAAAPAGGAGAGGAGGGAAGGFT